MKPTKKWGRDLKTTNSAKAFEMWGGSTSTGNENLIIFYYKSDNLFMGMNHMILIMQNIKNSPMFVFISRPFKISISYLMFFPMKWVEYDPSLSLSLSSCIYYLSTCIFWFLSTQILSSGGSVASKHGFWGFCSHVENVRTTLEPCQLDSCFRNFSLFLGFLIFFW